MGALAKRALLRVKGGGKSPSASLLPSPSNTPFMVAAREAFEASKADNFDAFAKAFKNAIALADDGEEE